MYIVKYSGPFGFIKPWTAVRDSETFSQQFLTPSIIEGIEKKLFPELLKVKGIHKIKRHRLTYKGISKQQEQIQPRGITQEPKSPRKTDKYIILKRDKSILSRGVLIEPDLYLCFDNRLDANTAFNQHICLARNEDILFPDMMHGIKEINENEFDENYRGFELIFEKSDDSFIVGYNRFNEAKAMYGKILIVGNNPLKSI